MTSLPRFSVNNPVLVNLFMCAIIVAGVFSAITLVREMFPETNPYAVRVTTIYPGATPIEMEKGISTKIEEVIEDIEEIEEIRTTNSEGISTINAVIYHEVDDVDQVVTDVKAAIDTIPRDEFPEEAEESQVFKFEPQLPVINVVFFGDMDDETLKKMGKRMRDDVLAIPGITKVALTGTRKDEISIDIKPEKLIEYDLSLPQISAAIGQANLDLPGGQIKTGGANVAVRTLGEEDQAQPIGDIIVRSDSDGRVIRLKDVAEVRDTFEDLDVVSRFNGKPAVQITVYKTQSQDAIEISGKVQAMVAGKTGKELEQTWLQKIQYGLGFKSERERVEAYETACNDPYPPMGRLKTATNLARFIEGRLDLLTRNGFWGLVWVFCSLLFFLNWRVAFWVMSGLLISVLGTLVVMQLIGYSLNLISMFGMIIVLGLLVDDAIVVGEHVFTKIENGVEPKLAAIRGSEEVTWPVTCAIATTIVAFAPLMYVKGLIGDFMGVLPVVVLVALVVSLVEALSILPSHLAEWLKPHKPVEHATVTSEFRGWAKRVRGVQTFFVQGVLLRNYDRFLQLCVRNRYVTISAMMSLLMVCLGLVFSSRVPFVFFQKMDSETIVADLKMPVGTPISQTGERIGVIEDAIGQLPEYDSYYSLAGVTYSMDGSTGATSSHLGQVILELKPVEERVRTSEDIIRELREKTKNLSGINSLKFAGMHGGPGGAPIQVEIGGDRIKDLITVADRVKKELSEYPGVFDIQDDFDAGRRELQIELLDSARALGLTTESLAMQVRGAFYGLEARIIQREREDVKIMVRYPEAYRKRIYDLESMRIATPAGDLVPFSEVARFKEGRGYATIKRKDQKRTVTVSADVDQDNPEANADMINADLASRFPALESEFPGLQLEFGGDQRERAKSFASLRQDAAAALLLIYVILAGLFKSYVQPAIVMFAIPFGAIGVVIGHMVLGYPLTMFSLIGLVALTGIVVNDSLILMTFINRRRAEGASPYEAVIDGGRARLRAILLTSITTILGLAPLLTETSFQAKFLIPMGISIASGLAFATILTLIGVPSLYLILIDVQALLGRVRAFLFGQGVESSPRAQASG
ncbi:MAG: efflux RND transporter permease subunit [Phycisphaerales bacterium]|nr:efflux RND transporter permease subunit [Phycisphaerales bacterium]